MRIALPAFLALILTGIALAQPANPMPAVVSPEWLKQHQGEPDLVVLHVAFNRREYVREHIPGARFIWFSWLSPSTPDGSTEMASASYAEQVLEGLGLTSSSRVVVYFTGNTISTTTRTIYSLMFFGFEGRVALLDGGLEGWKRSGGSVTSDMPSVASSDVSVTTQPELMADAEFIRQHLTDPSVTIVDARAKNFYEGSGSGMRPGHIKGAVNIPFSSIADTLNRIKTSEELEKIFRDAGVKKGNTIVAYCHVGQQATVVLTAARILGHPVRLYDGSFEEWPNLDESLYPVEQTPASDKP